MPHQEKSAWIMGILAVAGYAVYLVVLFGQAISVPLAETDYAPILLWTVGGAIVVSIVLHILLGAILPRAERFKDQRDREIGRFGEYTGQAFVVIGGVGALLLAMLEAGYFWIANLVYLAFVLSAVLSSVAKIVAYRRGFYSW